MSGLTTRQRVAWLVAAGAVAGVFAFWWTCTPDRDAIAALLGDVREAVEAGDLAPVLPAFRSDFAFTGGGGGGGSVVSYDELAEVGSRRLRRAGIEEVELRNVEFELDGDQAEVRALVQLRGSNDMLTARPIPIRIELTRSGDSDLYRGWRIYRAGLARLDTGTR